MLTDEDLQRAERQIEKTEDVASDLLEVEFLLKQVRRKIHFLNSDFPDEMQELENMLDFVKEKQFRFSYISVADKLCLEDLQEIQQLREETMEEIRKQEELENELGFLDECVDGSLYESMER